LRSMFKFRIIFRFQGRIIASSLATGPTLCLTSSMSGREQMQVYAFTFTLVITLF